MFLCFYYCTLAFKSTLCGKLYACMFILGPLVGIATFVSQIYTLNTVTFRFINIRFFICSRSILMLGSQMSRLKKNDELYVDLFEIHQVST